MITRLAVTVLTAGSVSLAAHAASGAVAASTAPVRVSGATPVASCQAAADSLLPPGSTEPVIAVNPRNSSNVVALWQQDHMHAIVAGVSSNRGRSWRPVNIAGMTSCTRGRLPYADDPSIGFGSPGRAAHRRARAAQPRLLTGR